MLRVISFIAGTALVVGIDTADVSAAEPIVGRASVTDGDTLVIGRTRIRLYGIDAPESTQICQDVAGKDYRCGQRAALALSDQIGQAPISCLPKDQDRYGRTVAVCLASGLDLNGWMVEQGHALAYRRYSVDYVRREDAARAAKRGIWAGTFTPPWDWRVARNDGPSRPAEEASGKPTPATPSTANCQIKGNINRKGEKIYHTPGSRSYERTVIDASAGERLFCSEREAEAAGWRKPLD